MCQLNLYKISPSVIPDLIRDPLLNPREFQVKPGMTGRINSKVLDVTAY
ncbi:MAG: hypothetical protein LBB91_04980 [Clostridiales bacterium]|jgi:hypothetical protein|nr:hypothetical protein [Clostridiales bacterium]